MFVTVTEEEWGADGKARGSAGTEQSGEFNNSVVLPYNLVFRVVMSLPAFMPLVCGSSHDSA